MRDKGQGTRDKEQEESDVGQVIRGEGHGMRERARGKSEQDIGLIF